MSYNWNDLYSGWGWMLWFGFIFLFFSSFGNWGYTYSAHRRYKDILPSKDAIDLLSERYARGDIDREEFHKMKSEIIEIKTDMIKSRTTGQKSSMKPVFNS